MEKKNVTRREFLSMFAAAAAGSVAAACTPATEVPQATAEPATEAPEPAATEVPQEQPPEPGFTGEIEIWDWYDARGELVGPLIEEWQDSHPDVTLTYTILDWGEMETKLLATVAAGNGPYMALTHNVWRYELQRGGVLTPYPDDLFDYGSLFSTPYFRDPANGNIYASVLGWTGFLPFYNKEILDAESIEPQDVPRKWDEFMRLCQQLTKRDGNGTMTQAGFSINNDYYNQLELYYDHVYQRGGWLYNEEGTQALWDEEPIVQALQDLKDIYHEWKVDDPEFLPMGDAFGNGKAAFMFSGGFMGNFIDLIWPDMAGKWGAVIEPTVTGEPLPAWGSTAPEEGYCVFDYTPAEIKALGFDFIKFVTDGAKRRVMWADFMDEVPDDKALLEMPELQANELVTIQAEMMPYRTCRGEIPPEADNVQRPIFEGAILEAKDVGELLEAGTKQMNEALAASEKKLYITERMYIPPSA